MLPLRSPGLRLAIAASILLALSPLAAAQQSDAAIKGPVSIGILVDNSVIDKGGAGAVRGALRTFLRSLRPPDEYAVFTLSDSFRVAQEFTKDAALADEPLRDLQPAEGGALYDGIISAVHYVSQRAKNQRKALLIFSSGEANGGRAGLSDTMYAAQTAGVQVFTVAVPGGGGRSWNLEQLAARTSGASYLPLQQSDLSSVSQIAARQMIGPPLPPEKPKPVVAPKPLAGYAELVVHRIAVDANDDTADFLPGDNISVQKALVASLAQKEIFPSITDATEAPPNAAPSPDIPPQTRLELVGTIVEYRRGSQFKRSTVGWLGSGAARLRIAFALRDVATGKTVLALEELASGSSSILSGSNEENQNQATSRLISNLIRDLQRNR